MPGDLENPEDWWQVEMAFIGDPTVWHFEWDWRYHSNLTDHIRVIGPDGILVMRHGDHFRQVMVRAIAWYRVIRK